MENASKALIMAGGVLIGLMILGALILMFNSLSSYQNTNQQGEAEAQVVEFNNQYVTYDNENVRGSDLYSLLNKVIDYNRRESSEGTGWSDNGQEVQFLPMTMVMTIKSSDLAQFTPDGTKRLIKSTTYTVDATHNTFENEVKGKIDDLEKEYGSDSLTNLTTGMTAIFIEDTDNADLQKEAINKFNSASRKVKVDEWKDIEPGSTIRNDVYTYYEYVQFKRLHFRCTGTDYDKQSGRIIEMNFESTGEFN